MMLNPNGLYILLTPFSHDPDLHLFILELQKLNLQASINRLIEADPAIEELFNVITLQVGPQVMLAAKVRLASGLTTGEAVARINQLERDLKAQHPEIGWSFVEPDATD